MCTVKKKEMTMLISWAPRSGTAYAYDYGTWQESYPQQGTSTGRLQYGDTDYERGVILTHRSCPSRRAFTGCCFWQLLERCQENTWDRLDKPHSCKGVCDAGLRGEFKSQSKRPFSFNLFSTLSSPLNGLTNDY